MPATSFGLPCQGHDYAVSPVRSRRDVAVDLDVQLILKSLKSALVFLRSIRQRLDDSDDDDLARFDCYHFQLEADEYLRSALHVVMVRFNLSPLDVEVMRTNFRPCEGRQHQDLYDGDEHAKILFGKLLIVLERWLNKVMLMPHWDRAAALEFVDDILAVQLALPKEDTNSSTWSSRTMPTSIMTSLAGGSAVGDRHLPSTQPWPQRRRHLPLEFAVGRSIELVQASAPPTTSTREGHQRPIGSCLQQ